MPGIRRDHKDRIFRKLFGDPDNKENLLSLYNALNDRDYDDPDMLEITTIDDVIYMGMKNDVSCIIDNHMSLIEQQSTYNPNMPLRGMLYSGQLYDQYITSHDFNRYSGKLIKIPAPKYFVLYNGTGNLPERSVLRLSDAFLVPADEEGCYEWTAIMLNINYGHNKKLLSACRVLEEYSLFVEKTRTHIAAGRSPKIAVELTVDECIHEGVLSNFLKKHNAEVIGMFLTEYDEAETMEMFKREFREDGIEEGRREGLQLGQDMLAWLKSQGRVDDIMRTISDDAFRDQMIAEYQASL